VLTTDRAVLLRYTRDGQSRRGSGLRIARRYVLTADHCADGADHRVIVGRQEYSASVLVRSQSSTVDLAVLQAPGLPEVERLPCALVNQKVARHLAGCTALGFPKWKDRDDGPRLAQVGGFVPTGEDATPSGGADTPRLMSLKITDPEAKASGRAVRPGDLDQTGSLWAGMSGAVLVTSDSVIIGVIRSHATAEGNSLTVTPLAAINALDGDRADIFWRALAVPDPRSLPTLPLPPEPVVELPATVPAPAAIHQLPPDIPDFTDRKTALAALRALLTQGDSAAVTVVALAGAPGVGKSAFAIHLAHALTQEFPDAQLYVDLRGAGPEHREPAEVLLGFLLALGVPAEHVPESDDERSGLYRSSLATKRALVVLDNAAVEAQVRPLLPGNPACAVLVTSRKELPALEATEFKVLNRLEPKAARSLLYRIAGRDRFTERSAAEDIVRLCGYLPLAIRIAGAKLRSKRHWTPTDFATRLSDERSRLAELSVGDREVRASFMLSYQDLSTKAAWAFRRLGVLPGPDFGIPVSAALLDVDPPVANALIETLVDAQLVEPASSDRYRFHDLMRLFAREQLGHEEAGAEIKAMVQRELDWYVQAARAASALLDGPRTHEGVDWFTAERENLTAAVRQARAEGFHETVWQLAAATSPYFDLRSMWDDWTGVQYLALATARDMVSGPREAEALCELGKIAWQRDHWDDAVSFFEESRNLFRGIAHHQIGEARALRYLAIIKRERGNLAEAIVDLRACLQIFEGAGDSPGRAHTLRSLGTTHRYRGDIGEALQCFESALLLFQEMRDNRSTALTVRSIGMVQRYERRLADAISSFEQSLAIYEELGEGRQVAYTLRDLGAIYRESGRLEDSLRCFDRCLPMFEELGDRLGMARSRRNLGLIRLERDDLTGATELLEESRAGFLDVGDRRRVGIAEHGLGLVALRAGHFENAVTRMDEALRIFRDVGDRLWEAKALRSLGTILESKRDPIRADAVRRQALSIFRALGLPDADDVASAPSRYWLI
jgi:tetratricopeptide (TPR) repeat protein